MRRIIRYMVLVVRPSGDLVREKPTLHAGCLPPLMGNPCAGAVAESKAGYSSNGKNSHRIKHGLRASTQLVLRSPFFR